MSISRISLWLLAAFILASCNKRLVPPAPNLADFVNGMRQFVGLSPEFRTFSGAGNNLNNFTLGQTMTPLARFPFEFYSDGAQVPGGINRTADYPRRVSNAVNAAGNFVIENEKGASDYLWAWGQFLDHDMSLTGPADPEQHFDIGIPTGDRFFDPLGTGTQTMEFKRSEFQTNNGVREQINQLSAFIDASNVYGSDSNRAQALRARNGLSPYLATSNGNFMPYNTQRLANEPSDDPQVDPTSLFLAGDVRANENVVLASLHTIFVREHNYIVDLILSYFPNLTSEMVYQLARAVVAAEMQAITYNEFLPVLLGDNAMPAYHGYNAGVDPRIHFFFSTAAFRLGHSMVSPTILRVDPNGDTAIGGHLALSDAFFKDVPGKIVTGGIDVVLRGLTKQKAQAIDVFVIDELRNFLFGPPGAGGLDLVSLNIQRGRDHGLPYYNDARRMYGLLPGFGFDSLTDKTDIQTKLSQVYTSADEIDPWVAGLAEDHVDDALVGPLFFVSIKDQFQRLRDGDRFWYENYLPRPLVTWIQSSTLARIIRRNTLIGGEIPELVFFVD